MAIRKAHLWIGFFLGIITPVVAVATTFYNMRSTLSDRISAVQLEAANQFVKKEEFKNVQVKIDLLLSETSELKGMLKMHMNRTHEQ
jgi:hypothetical protein